MRAVDKSDHASGAAPHRAVPPLSPPPLPPSLPPTTGLTSLLPYNAYCYAEAAAAAATAANAPMTLPAVLATKTPFTTACCRLLAFTNAPPAVFGDANPYLTARAPPATYTFTFALEAPLAAGTLVVRPVLRPLDAQARASAPKVVAVPPTITLAPSALVPADRGTFYLTTAVAALLRNANGSFALYLNVSGSAAGAYANSAPVAVALLPPGAALPPPALAGCALVPSGAYVECVFSGPTDMAGMPAGLASTWPCANLLTFQVRGAGGGQGGQAAAMACRWTDASTLRALYGPYNASTAARLPRPGDTASLAPGAALRAQCLLAASASKGCAVYKPADTGVVVPVAALTDPVQPGVVVVAAGAIGPCEDLALDLSSSTGQLGRPWVAAAFAVAPAAGTATGRPLTATASAAQLAAVATYLNAAFDTTGGRVRVPRALLTPGAGYTITATLTNFLGSAGAGTATVQVRWPAWMYRCPPPSRHTYPPPPPGVSCPRCRWLTMCTCRPSKSPGPRRSPSRPPCPCNSSRPPPCPTAPQAAPRPPPPASTSPGRSSTAPDTCATTSSRATSTPRNSSSAPAHSPPVGRTPPSSQRRRCATRI